MKAYDMSLGEFIMQKGSIDIDELKKEYENNYIQLKLDLKTLEEKGCITICNNIVTFIKKI